MALVVFFLKPLIPFGIPVLVNQRWLYNKLFTRIPSFEIYSIEKQQLNFGSNSVTTFFPL